VPDAGSLDRALVRALHPVPAMRMSTGLALLASGCTVSGATFRGVGPDAAITGDSADEDAGADAAPSGPAAACAELGSAVLGSDVTLYFDHDAAKPFAAHCADPGDGSIATYILLGTAVNTSSYPRAGCAILMTGQSQEVVTTWPRLRFDPASHVVDTSDFTGSTSTGGTHEDSGNGTIHNDYPRMVYGSGRSCVPGTPKVVAMVDLSQTRFAITPSQVWYPVGTSALGGAVIDAARKTATISITGFPAGVSPCPGNGDYYTLTGGPCLALTYAP
jgi:hypothetical protein